MSSSAATATPAAAAPPVAAQTGATHTSAGHSSAALPGAAPAIATRGGAGPAIRVQGVSKVYTLAHQAARPGPGGATVTLGEALLRRLRRPFARGAGAAESSGASEAFWALRDVSFEVAQGEVVGIVGRNGAGKSTLLKILSRITAPTSGRAELYGRVGSLLEVGTGFHRELTGRENIFLNGAILGMTRKEIARQFDAIVDFSGTEKFLDTPVKHYSSGMYVRLAFAVAAHLNPEILIVDEVLAVGDAEFQKKCLGKMSEAAKGGRTVLFVSHNMGAVSTLCHRGVLLSEGRVKLVGPVDAVVAEYLKVDRTASAGGDVTRHPNRPPKFKPIITRFEIEADDAGIAHWGRPLSIRIGYDLPEPLAAPQFAVRFATTTGFKVFTLISSYQRNDIPWSIEGKGEVVCHVPALPLMPGEYNLSVRLWQSKQLLLDEVENVAALQVEWLGRDIGQFNWNSTHGAVYVDASWSVAPRARDGDGGAPNGEAAGIAGGAAPPPGL